MCFHEVSLYCALWKLRFFIVCHVCSANFISESLFRPQNSLDFISKLCPSHSFRDNLCITLHVFHFKGLFKSENAAFLKNKTIKEGNIAVNKAAI